ncbi:hypothetical protein C0Z19_01345 [Trinickia soli]|uniref:Uncharacterized protein n=1 Tax=Trinickia soli TaxID=380675 RepID=A0A2N7WGB2_9BURK|nr:hypothetical protein C0Z19_01345 [Trinickia soli]
MKRPGCSHIRPRQKDSEVGGVFRYDDSVLWALERQTVFRTDCIKPAIPQRRCADAIFDRERQRAAASAH